MLIRLSIQLRVCGDLTTERHPVVIANPGHRWLQGTKYIPRKDAMTKHQRLLAI